MYKSANPISTVLHQIEDPFLIRITIILCITKKGKMLTLKFDNDVF